MPARNSSIVSASRSDPTSGSTATIGGGQTTCHAYDSPNGGAWEVTVNPTARWPERLAHIAALLRAEGAAVVATSGDDLRTVFTHDISPQTNWRAIFDADAVVRALNGATVGSAVAAGRWDEQAAFALLTRIDLPDGEALLCALRHGVPFDAVELSTASSAAELLAMSVGDGRAMADAKHESAQQNDRVALLEHLLTGLEETRDASALLARAAEDIATRMGAGGTSIMLIEGKRLRVRASVGIGVPLGHEQRVDEGIAGWVASRGERVVLRGPIDDDRFRGRECEGRGPARIGRPSGGRAARPTVRAQRGAAGGTGRGCPRAPGAYRGGVGAHEALWRSGARRRGSPRHAARSPRAARARGTPRRGHHRHLRGSRRPHRRERTRRRAARPRASRRERAGGRHSNP